MLQKFHTIAQSAALAYSALFSLAAFGQVIPTERTTEWNNAGFHLEIPEPTLFLDMLDHGAVGDGLSPNNSALVQAFAAAQGQVTVITFPAGDFLFTAGIVLPDSVILRGEGAGATNLIFDLSGTGHCIVAAGQEMAPTYPLAADAFRGASSIQLIGDPVLSAGDLVRLYRDDEDLVVSPWAVGATGQLVHVAAVDQNVITLVSPLRAHYTIDGAAYVHKVVPRMFSGIECLRIERLDETVEQFSNIWFNKASHCWVRGVESDVANFSHIELYESTNCEISGNYLHHAFSYGTGGKAYGVNIFHTSGENLVENNIFERLRHSMIVHIGANGNVLAYNFSTDPFWTQGGLPANSAGDLVLHGDHPYLNLFEGNIVQNIVIDDSHGSNGPFNTLFRNGAYTWGLLMNNAPATDSVNIVGNDVVNTQGGLSLFLLNGVGHFLYGNNYQGTISPEGTGDLADVSYYLDGTPAFLQPVGGLPQIGPNALPPGNIPARIRFMAGDQLTVCPGDIITALTPAGSRPDLIFLPNPFTDRIMIEGLDVSGDRIGIVLYDLTGKVVHSRRIASADRITIDGLAGLRAGAYVMEVQDGSGVNTRTLVVKE